MSVKKGFPCITFGMIVLNGEPFLKYNLRSLYPFAHQIIVVEGASQKAAAIATPDGHSIDDTLEVLHRFKAEEDPENKVTIVTAEDNDHPNGFWPGEKDEQSQAYAERATGDYLWQVDVDEFYKPEDMKAVVQLLLHAPQITAMSFKQLTFWGSLDYVVDGWYLRRGAETYHRLFRFGPGYRYVKHRPPTVCDPQGNDLRSLHWLDGPQLARRGIYLYHYSLLLPKHVRDKAEYYTRAEFVRSPYMNDWAEHCYLRLERPYRVHNVYRHPSWLERFRGTHPPAVLQMMDDIRSGKLNFDLRPTDDVESLLSSWWYPLGRQFLKTVDPMDQALNWIWKQANRIPRVPRKLKHMLARWLEQK